MRDDHADHLEGTTTMHDEKTTVYRVADEKAVRDLYRELMDGWNRGSGEDFAAVFTEDGDLVAFDGTHFEGREEIAPFHQELFDKWMKGTRLVGRVKDVRLLRRRVSWALATREARESDAPLASTRSLGLKSKDTPPCSSTPSWNRIMVPCDFGRRLDFTSSEPFPKPSSIPR